MRQQAVHLLRVVALLCEWHFACRLTRYRGIDGSYVLTPKPIVQRRKGRLAAECAGKMAFACNMAFSRCRRTASILDAPKICSGSTRRIVSWSGPHSIVPEWQQSKMIQMPGRRLGNIFEPMVQLVINDRVFKQIRVGGAATSVTRQKDFIEPIDFVERLAIRDVPLLAAVPREENYDLLFWRRIVGKLRKLTLDVGFRRLAVHKDRNMTRPGMQFTEDLLHDLDVVRRPRELGTGEVRIVAAPDRQRERHPILVRFVATGITRSGRTAIR